MSKISGVNLITRLPGAVIDTLVNTVPQTTIKGKKSLKTIDWIGEKFSSPENRLILGVTALMTQPFIDYFNTKVDEETRKVSVARTVAKIIAGTTTGYFVRAGSIKLIDAMTKLPSEVNTNTFAGRMRTLFTPDVAIKNLTKYKNAIGTLLSLFVMMFTNFAIDAPLTKYLTNVFSDKISKHKNKQGGKVNE